MPTARIAKSLDQLRSEVNALAPNRSKDSDGWIGDAAHSSRKSEHNPDDNGVVRALDITHDPAHGVDSYQLAEALRLKKDKRILYIISNGQICNSRVSPWEWRRYDGQNPHTHHMHVSVVEEPSLYDDTTSWGIALSPPSADGAASAHPRIKEGDNGAAASEAQRLLGIAVTGSFGPETTAAARAFQAAHNLEVDGIIGPYTWGAMLQASRGSAAPKRQTGITATVFGGPTDNETSAYDGHVIGMTELGVALPFRFRGALPEVRVTNAANGKSVICKIVDVGPWNIDDPYWARGTRPQAESGTDNRGRPTNRAGIDLTPAAAKEIGIPGKGTVDWEFVGVDVEEPLPEHPHDLSAVLKQVVDRWEKRMADVVQQSGTAPNAGSANNAAAVAEILQAVATAVQKHAAASASGDAPDAKAGTNVPDVIQAVISGLLGKALPAPQPSQGGTPAATSAPVLTTIDKLLGGEALAGKKTLISVIAFAIQLILMFSGVPIGPGTANTAGNILTTLIGAFGGLGVVSKVDRVVQLLGMIAAKK